jgi:hypothetical protein
MRKGKKETIKGIDVPEEPKRPEERRRPPTLSLDSNGDEFKARWEESNLSISIEGKGDKGKAGQLRIRIRSGQDVQEYSALDKVPEAQRDQVKKLLELAERSLQPDKKP